MILQREREKEGGVLGGGAQSQQRAVRPPQSLLSVSDSTPLHIKDFNAETQSGLKLDQNRTMVPVKLLVLGAQNTGKTGGSSSSEGQSTRALCVRFITKRFIGEYDHKKEMTYRCSRLLDQESVDLEILDMARKESSLESSIRWADGFLLLYSITHRLSFTEVPRLKKLIEQTKQSLVVPTVLVANKADLEIGREVTTEEGQRLAKDLRCGFRELSVAEAVLAVEAAVLQLIRLVLDQQRPHPDRRSYMLSVRHALTRKLTRSKTMQW